MFIALHLPNTRVSAGCRLYLAFTENVLLYVALAAIIWPVAHAIREDAT